MGEGGCGTYLSPKVSSRSCSLPSSWVSWVMEWRSLEASWWAFACSSLTALARLDSTADARTHERLDDRLQAGCYFVSIALKPA